jgi:toxin ParE1/3/4
MKLAAERSTWFDADVTNQFGWYLNEGGESLAWRFFEAVDLTLSKLCRQPDLGRIRHFRHPALQNLRSFGVAPPFNRFVIFYRATETSLQVLRLMHGARDLPQRLTESPEHGQET